MTVALCGDGGDELFAGYERFSAGVALARAAAVPGAVRRGIGRAAGSLSATRRGRVASVARMLRRAGDEMPDAYLSWVTFVPFDRAGRLLGDAGNVALDEYRAIWRRSDGSPPLDRLLDLNVRTYLLDDLLPKVDRMAMAHGLEVRSPFLDTALSRVRAPAAARPQAAGALAQARAARRPWPTCCRATS